MRQGRFARSGWVALLVFCVATVGLAAGASSASADEPQVSWVTPNVEHACPSGSNLVTQWGYVNSGTAITFGHPDPGDDDLPSGGDGDNDDDFFYPTASANGDIGQPVTFPVGTSHNAFTTTTAANLSPALTWTLGNQHATSSGPLNCADVSILKTQLLDTVTTGQQEQYTLTVKNNGPTTASGVATSDTLPAGVTPTAATTT